MKTIAVDIDDTLIPTTTQIVRLSHERWGTPAEIRTSGVINFPKLWNVDAKEADQRMRELLTDPRVNDAQPFEIVGDVLDRLRVKYRLIVLTARPGDHLDYTRVWIEKHLAGMFDDVHAVGLFTNQHSSTAKKRNKGDFCESLGFDFLIDDQVNHCESVARCGRKALLFGDYAWNCDAKIIGGMTRVRDWSDVEEYFEKEVI